MKIIRTVLVGLGNVNIGLLEILKEKGAAIAVDHDLEISIVGAADSSGVAVKDSGFTFEELIALKQDGRRVSDLEGHIPSMPAEDIAGSVEADLLVEATPVNLGSGDPGLASIQNALARGWSVVTANKAPLVLAFDELHRLSRKHGGKLAYSAAVCGGLPVINVLRRDLRATDLISLKGVLNATTNFIVEELRQDGSFDDAVRQAQEIGAAETDPSLDIDGFDSANKLYIIMKSFTDFSGVLADITIEGIRNISAESIGKAAERNKRIKLIASAEKQVGGWSMFVKPAEVEADSFLGGCDGWEMGIQLQTDYYNGLAMKIREEQPTSTCAAVLRDIVNLFVEERSF